MAALGRPVVPPVYGRAARSFLGSIRTWGGSGGYFFIKSWKFKSPAALIMAASGTSMPPKALAITFLANTFFKVGRYSSMLVRMTFLTSTPERATLSYSMSWQTTVWAPLSESWWATSWLV